MMISARDGVSTDRVVRNVTDVLRERRGIRAGEDDDFSVLDTKEIADALIAARRNVVSCVIESDQGHDAFLLPIPRYFDVLGGYFDRIARDLEHAC